MSPRSSIRVHACALIAWGLAGASHGHAAEFLGRVVDARSGEPLAARVSIEGPPGTWRFVEAAATGGLALPYDEQWVPMPRSVERHTTVSAHPFRAELPPGRYRLVVERGKEYHTLEEEFDVGRARVERTLRLRRWVDMAARGWYSGETHVHRRIEDLPQVVLAEDLNVAFPVTFWTVRAFEVPTTAPSPLRPTPDPRGDRRDMGAEPIQVDATHVLVPRNTEYEIFSVGERRHVLGAIFVLNHRRAFDVGMPPVRPVAEQAHREGALLDLDKHNWPWSLMLVPVAKVDLFELANNSVWRTEFGFRSSLVEPAPYMEVERDDGGMTERGWLEYGFQVYYALLNCGFRLRPTAGTASGVHPVPLGYSRVYVKLDGPFDFRRWYEGLGAGRSFVTNGPMILASLDGQDPGHTSRSIDGTPWDGRLTGEILSARPLSRIELIRNGAVVKVIDPENREAAEGAYAHTLAETLSIPESSWVAIRCFQPEPSGRPRFAHTGPFHVEVDGKPLRPRRREVDYLVGRMREELARNAGVLPEAALEEFRDALRAYERIAETAAD